MSRNARMRGPVALAVALVLAVAATGIAVPEALAAEFGSVGAGGSEIGSWSGVSGMLRLYNQWSGEHLYTTSEEEYNSLVALGWEGEGYTWGTWDPNDRSGIRAFPTVVVTDPDSFGLVYSTGFVPDDQTDLEPVYRLYNPYSGDHHYTTSEAEYDQLGQIGWSQEGPAFYAWVVIEDGQALLRETGVAQRIVYRLYNPWLAVGSHLYTSDADERDSLVAQGWQYEGQTFAVRSFT